MRVHINKKMKRGELMEFPKQTRASGTVSIGDSAKLNKQLIKDTFPGVPKRESSASKLRHIDTVNLSAPHRNCVWIQYRKGEVSSEPSNEMDVISGQFSGCYMIKYRFNGSWRVAHIDTADGGGPAAIAAWNQMLLDPLVEIACGFKPFQAKFADGFGIATVTYGIINSDNECHSIVANATGLYHGPSKLFTEIRLIRKVTKQRSIPVAKLRALTLMNA
jgi:hypothetical protein